MNNPFIWSGGTPKCGTSYLFYNVFGSSTNYEVNTWENRFNDKWLTPGSKAWKCADLFWHFDHYQQHVNKIFAAHAGNAHCIFLIRDLNEQFEAWWWNTCMKHRNDPPGSPHKAFDLTRDQLYARDIAAYRRLPQTINKVRDLCHKHKHTFHLIDHSELCSNNPIDLLNSRGIPIKADKLRDNWQPFKSSRKPQKQYDELSSIYESILP